MSACYWGADFEKTICPEHGKPIGECPVTGVIGLAGAIQRRQASPANCAECPAKRYACDHERGSILCHATLWRFYTFF
jgi:hypothetical protein